MEIETLKSELQNKQELVVALTRQLEQAADQLDRVQRTGTQSVSKTSTASNEVAQDVSYLARQWEETQVADSFSQIQLQLAEMRELLAQPAVAPQPASYLAKQELENEKLASDYSTEKDPSQEELIGYLQSAFFQNKPEIPDTVLEEKINTESVTELVTVDLPVQPEPIDFENKTSQQLQQAVLERDSYIETILDYLSQARKHFGVQPPKDWDSLQGCPEELLEQVQRLKRQLEDQLRLSEVSLSLERARLSREEMELNAARIQIEKTLRKQGLDPRSIQGLDLQTDSDTVIMEENTKQTNWFNMLRIKKQS